MESPSVGYGMNYEEVAVTLENFIDGGGSPWDWDVYTLGVSFEDPYLRNIQIRMANLGNQFPPLQKGHYCGPEGIEVIRCYIRELRAKAQNA
jgi:hypothetical protein